MYKSKLEISTKSKKHLINFLNKYLEKNKKCYCKSLGRKVDLGKLPEVIINRKSSSTQRLQRFVVAIDILKHEKKYKLNPANNSEFEIIGFDNNDKKIYIHLREEVTSGKDKILYFISCF